jgi:hypothetical protein
MCDVCHKKVEEGEEDGCMFFGCVGQNKEERASLIVPASTASSKPPVSPNQRYRVTPSSNNVRKTVASCVPHPYRVTLRTVYNVCNVCGRRKTCVSDGGDESGLSSSFVGSYVKTDRNFSHKIKAKGV